MIYHSAHYRMPAARDAVRAIEHGGANMKRIKFILSLAGALTAASFIAAPAAMAGGYGARPAPSVHISRPPLPRPVTTVSHAPRFVHHGHFNGGRGGRGFVHFAPRFHGPFVQPRFVQPRFVHSAPRFHGGFIHHAPRTVQFAPRFHPAQFHAAHQFRPVAFNRGPVFHGAPAHHANFAPRPIVSRPVAIPHIKAPVRIASRSRHY